MTAAEPVRAPGRAGPARAAAPAPDPAGRGTRKVFFLTVLAAASVIFLYPFVWLVVASLKPRDRTFSDPFLPWPVPFRPENYAAVWDAAPMLAWLVNTVVVGVAAALAVTLSSAFVAFGFAYFRFPGRNLIFGSVLATMMLPAAVTLVPTFLIWNAAGLTGTQVPLWAGNLFGSAFYIFLLRQFLLGVPRYVFEAARVDGASYLDLFRRIALPLSRPALIIAFVFELKASWFDLMKPLIYLQDPALYTLPRGLKAVVDQFYQGGDPKWEIVLAASVVTTLPLVVVFFLGQRYFVQGIATTGRR
ncbi:carbohydrate ABC transporter permease [Planomonospora venezuelensis]|uniref:Multiple sugar transport system permease protein n=1 Tax=Planomonospora venezuelensis TaxID=1999 RepID=A0A841DC20_PLAVE|nr:carbohydrate ABC transporter permease [Planomonospora venezuelensis]MBB5966353.1 multiple sugar transport system permease protein [Planomonospora venezuelensis]GIM99760.1 sugar ABC transporter permease [Planomonospora venezuelensis]